MTAPVPDRRDPGCGGQQPEIGSQVVTACNCRMRFSADTPCALFRDEKIYFCLPACKEDYEQDPYTSCLAGRLYNL